MIKPSRNEIQVLLISIALLISQLSILIHSAEHPFHNADQSCRIFISLEQSEESLIAAEIDLSVLPKAVFFNPDQLTSVAPSASRVFDSRAPPAFI